MASPTPKSASKPQALRPRLNSKEPPEAVDPIWLLRAIGIVIVAALCCGYAALCLLFYQGQWQLVLHPSKSASVPADIAGSTFQTVRFGVDESGVPQLTGWLIPAERGARYASYTVMYLPSGDGSLADSVHTFAALHALGIGIFAFDYRGYGQSAATHPNQRRMTDDATSAWQYLTVSRAFIPSKIVLFGDGVGCALAASFSAAHPEVRAVILQAPRPDLLQVVLSDSRTRSLPVRLLFHDRFDIAETVTSLKTPKLFLISDRSSKLVQQTALTAATPKMVSSLPAADFDGPVYRVEIARFLDQSLF